MPYFDTGTAIAEIALCLQHKPCEDMHSRRACEGDALGIDKQKSVSASVGVQGAKMNAVAEREQSERALQKQSRLTAAAEAHERNVADRDRFMRELAARLSLQELPAQGTISANTTNSCASSSALTPA